MKRHFCFFYYHGKNVLTDDPYMGTINEILLELDNLPSRISGTERVGILYDLIEKKVLKFKK